MATIHVRKATKADVPRLGEMGGALARLHHGFDPPRFALWDDLESGYGWWLGKELGNERAVVLVAELEDRVVGYAYGVAEERDWSTFLDAHGAFHDVWVDEAARTAGAGRALSLAMIDALTALGSPQVVLKTATRNEAARRLFEKLGFRATMTEMTRGT